MEHENAFATGPVRCVSASTYLRLRFLDAHTVSEEVGGLSWWPVLWSTPQNCLHPGTVA